jgi:hypothetical protein
MTSINPAYGSALESRDIRRYPNEISKIPDRGSVAAADLERGVTFSDVVAGVTAETPDAPTGAILPKLNPDKPFRLWEKEQFGFGDFVDIINPLQHIPIVATIYRNMSGDKIGLAPRVIGGAIWGRIGGFVSGIVNAIVDWFTGKDIGDHIYSALFGTPENSGAARAVAQSANPSSQSSEIQIVTPAKIRPDEEQVKLTFAPFNDDGGFALETSKEIAAAEHDAGPASVTIVAVNSYVTNLDLDESRESFRFRFPA